MTTPNIRELRRQRARRHASGPILLKILIAIASLYVVYVLVGFLIAPSVLKTQIERRASAQLKREVSVDHVAFNPVMLTLRLDKVMVRDRDGQQLLGWGKLFVNFQLFSLFADEIHFSEIELDGFSARLAVSKQGILNIADIIPPTPASPSPNKSWTMMIDRLTVNRSEIDYSDASRAEPFTTQVGPMTFVLRNFRTSGGPGAPGEFKATTEAGESVEWSGRLALAPLRSNGEVRLTRIALKKYAPFYAGMVKFDVLNGTLDARAPYEFSIENNQPQIKITEGAVQAQGLELAERGKTEAVVSLKSLDIAHAALDLQANSADIRQINLGGGSFLVRRDNSGINLEKLFAPGTSSASVSAKPAASTPSLSAKFGEVNGKDFTFSIEDKSTPRPAALQLSHANFSLKRFALNDLAAGVPIDFRADLSPGGGTVHLEGQVSASPLKADLTYAIEGASLAALSPWAETFADFRLTEGVAGVRGQVHTKPGPSGGAAVVVATSDLDVSLLSATDAKGGALFGWKSLVVRGAEYSSTPARITVTEISLADPTIKLIMSRDHVLNVSSILRQTAGATPPPTVALANAPAQFIAIDRVAMANASVSYADQSMDPNVTTSIDQLSGTVTGLTSAAIDRGDVTLNGRIGGTAPISVAGKINVLSNAPAADLKIDLKETDLLPFGAYIGKFAGFELTSGALSIDSKAKVVNRKLDSTTTIVITNFALGAPTNSPDALHVPIHLAVSLLKDREGKIVLADLPVQGSLDDPNFEISGVIMHVVGNLITKAATSPFSLIGSIFGGGRSGEDLSFQEFAAGSSQLAESNLKKLEVVGRALRERPALHLAVTGSADPAVDLPPMRERELELRIRTAIWGEARKVDSSLESPDKVTVSREGADRIIGLFYRDAFAPPPPEVAAAPAKPSAEPPPRRGFFLFRWFSRSKPVAPPAAPVAAVPRTSPAPRPGKPAGAGGPVIGAEYGKVIGAEYGTVIGADKNSSAGLPPVGEMRDRLLEAIPIGDAELRKLAGERAEKIRSYMITQGQVSPDQVELAIDPSAKAGTRAILQLK